MRAMAALGLAVAVVGLLALGAEGDNGAQGFDCPHAGPSPAVPDSVHKLRPGDIKVVSAFGDSLTAGTGAGAKNYLQIFKQFRGLSWAIGGDGNLEDMITIPNILETLNHVIGSSHGVGPATGEEANLNVAIPGSKIWDLPDQVVELVRRIKVDPAIDFEKDWKLVTLFIGTNDLCQECKGAKENHHKGNPFGTKRPFWAKTTPGPSQAPTPKPSRVQPLKDVLRLLHDQLPRTFVSLANVNNVHQLIDIHNQSKTCKIFHSFLCPCLLQPDFLQKQAELQAEIREVAADPALHDKEDFSVALQPLLEHYEFPKTADGEVDMSFMSPDCFHWSQTAHNRLAASLWNNVVSPAGAKATAVTDRAAPLACPDPHCPFLRTPRNSHNC